jgi:hypothetical protein
MVAKIQAAPRSMPASLWGQHCWRHNLGVGRLMLAASYFDLNSVQNRNPFYSGANGNTTKSFGCVGGSPCLENDYNLMELMGEWARTVAGQPLALYVDYIKNDAVANGLDTGFSTGIQYGRAADPHTWEVGYYHQSVEKGALCTVSTSIPIGELEIQTPKGMW